VTTLRKSRPSSAKFAPRTNICKTALPATGLTNCGRRARKKSATLGLRTFDATPCRKMLPSPVAAAATL
jgi:hypothetical protein